MQGCWSSKERLKPVHRLPRTRQKTIGEGKKKKKRTVKRDGTLTQLALTSDLYLFQNSHGRESQRNVTRAQAEVREHELPGCLVNFHYYTCIYCRLAQ